MYKDSPAFLSHEHKEIKAKTKESSQLKYPQTKEKKKNSTKILADIKKKNINKESNLRREYIYKKKSSWGTNVHRC